ncbi:MAG: YqgE/AlgH family protein [Acidimicrobiales bacterium]|jgi:putative transcriptional regulator
MSAPPAKGRLVVASPTLEDPNFHRTVVFLLAADDDGALGVVLNRPSETAIDEVVPHWGSHASEPPVLFVGGPVQPNAAICVGRTNEGARLQDAGTGLTDGDEDEADGFSPLVGDLGTVDLNRAPEEIGVSFAGLRVFTGYSGWGPGQLEEEIEAGAWFVVEARQTDVLSAEPEELWERVLRRQGGWLAVLARHPVDASLN